MANLHPDLLNRRLVFPIPTMGVAVLLDCFAGEKEMKENLLVLGFVLGGLFLIIWGAIQDTGLIPIGIGLFTTVAGYLYGTKAGETRTMKKILSQQNVITYTKYFTKEK